MSYDQNSESFDETLNECTETANALEQSFRRNLIDVVSNHPIIYNTKHPDRKSTGKMETAWISIACLVQSDSKYTCHIGWLAYYKFH